jgi:hypothetical protein
MSQDCDAITVGGGLCDLPEHFPRPDVERPSLPTGAGMSAVLCHR